MSGVTKDTYQSFLQSVLAKVPEADRETVEAVFQNEAVAPVLRDSVLARSDYSRNQDALAEAREALDAEVAEARNQIAEWQDWYAKNSGAAEELRAKAQQYEELYGPLDEDGASPVTRHRTTADTNTLTREELQSQLLQRDQLAIKFADMLTDIKVEHRALYGEKLDSESLLAYANKHGKPIDVAYKEIMAPREAERAEAVLKEKLAQAREEGRQAVMTEHKLPVQPAHREIHVLDRQKDAFKDSGDRVAAAVARFNAAVATGR
jgi:hypothetical protein